MQNKLVMAAAAGLAIALAAAGLWLFQRSSPSQSQAARPAPAAALAETDRPVIVVLPFTNLAVDRREEYFSDGMTEEMTTALARIPGFLVIARNSAFAYKGRPVNPQVVGRDLKVRYALQGGAQKQGERLRLEAQLIDTQTGGEVWAETYDRSFADIFVVLEELTDKIVGSAAPTLKRAEGVKTLPAPPETLAAYDLTMRARHMIARAGDRDTSTTARAALEQAIARDPSFAEAHAYLALTHDRFRINNWNDEFGTAAIAERATAAAAKAVSLAPRDAVT
ncbi:MAG: hypothetical protein EXQ88_00310 [Alphaproteobacteria bacterium]|nr:hypothetical protein [Alphaproteobacteria bacterium]